MTEAEAKTRWCPFSRTAQHPRYAPEGTTITANRGPMISQDICCMGSECMAWRWASERKHGDKRLGFCGLAGQLGYLR